MRTAFSLSLVLAVGLTARLATAAEAAPSGNQAWQVGTPIVTYWAGPPLTDAVAQQMAEGGFNVVWCSEQQLDIARQHGLRAQLSDGLLSPATLDDPAARDKLDALIQRVRQHPAMYSVELELAPGGGRLVRLAP